MPRQQNIPYPYIARHLLSGSIVPVLGAGASFGANVSSDIKTSTIFKELPGGRELSKYLAEDISFPSEDPGEIGDLARVTSYYLASVGRSGLVDTLSEVFKVKYTPQPIHEFLAGIKHPILIITTNYDDLMEQAMIAQKRDFHLIVYPTDQPSLGETLLYQSPGNYGGEFDEIDPVDFDPIQYEEGSDRKLKSPILFKMHGAIDPTNHRRNSFVITEDDYVSFLSRMTNRTAIPSDFKLRFLNSSFLFLGYGLNDWNFRLMLKRLSDPDEFPATTLGKENGDARKHQLSGQKWSWAIQKNCTQVDKGIWEMNDVRIFDLDLNEFVEKLQSQK